LKLTIGLSFTERLKYGSDFLCITIRQERFHFVTEEDKGNALHNTVKSTIESYHFTLHFTNKTSLESSINNNNIILMRSTGVALAKISPPERCQETTTFPLGVPNIALTEVSTLLRRTLAGGGTIFNME
jgi:hypothetical protein